MFSLFVIVLIIILLSLLIVSNYNNIVLHYLNSNKLNEFKFLFVRVK